MEAKSQPETVKLAYYKLARLYHRDVNNSANAQNQMRAINKVYRHLQERFNQK